MRQPVYLIAENIISPLGFTARENLEQLRENNTGISLHKKPAFSPVPFYAALMEDDIAVPGLESYTRFEQLLIRSVKDALNGAAITAGNADTILVISSTKGNISLLEQQAPVNAALKKRMTLHHAAKQVAEYFGFVHRPVIVSHACISGLVAIITAMRLLQSGKYKHAVVSGADVITRFVLSGFQSFHAVSDEPCRPFDADRKGINLGEGAATLVLSVEKKPDAVRVAGGAVSNDANHISGPSRTGAELFQAVTGALAEAGIDKKEIDCISAHGTATLYNDEMEAKAMNLAGLQDVPLHSIKGYYGHTLGAAGLIETAVAALSLKEKIFLPTKGYIRPGTTQHVQVNSILQRGNFNTCLKVASGFGGCNAALILQLQQPT